MSKLHHDDELTRRVTDLTAIVDALTRRLSVMENALRDKAPGVMPSLQHIPHDTHASIRS